jgi:hypothetical protein
VARETRFASTVAGIWKSARGHTGTQRAAAVVRGDAMVGTTADHETAPVYDLAQWVATIFR